MEPGRESEQWSSTDRGIGHQCERNLGSGKSWSIFADHRTLQRKAVHAPSNKGTLTGQLNGVAAASTNNVWAVGGLYDQQQASTYHWDGTHWSNIANPILPFSYLYGVAVTSAGDFWAVGSYNPPNSYAQTVIEVYC